jgi:hypothetical protein
LWGVKAASFPFPAAAIPKANVHIAALAAADAAGGTGLRELVLESLDDDFYLFEETLALAGDTIIHPATDVRRFNRMKSGAVGSGGVNAGDIVATVDSATTKAITAITKADPAVVTSAGHGLVAGDLVTIVGGEMVELHGRMLVVGTAAEDTFELAGVNSTTYTDYVSGGAWIKQTIQARMVAGYGRSSALAYTVPMGMQCLICAMGINAVGGTDESAQIHLQGRMFGKGWETYIVAVCAWGTRCEAALVVPIELPAKTDLRMRIMSVSSNNLAIAGQLELVLF